MPQRFNQGELMARVVATIIIGVVFVVGSLLYIAFPGSALDVFQKIVVFIVAVIIAWAIIALIWISWASKRGFMNPQRWQNWKQ